VTWIEMTQEESPLVDFS